MDLTHLVHLHLKRTSKHEVSEFKSDLIRYNLQCARKKKKGKLTGGSNKGAKGNYLKNWGRNSQNGAGRLKAEADKREMKLYTQGQV